MFNPIVSPTWIAHSLRLTAFPVLSENGAKEAWWRELLGDEPEETTSKKLVWTQEGEFNGAHLKLTVDPLRIQWDWIPRVDPANMTLEFPSLGAYPEVSEPFRSLMEKWLGIAPAIKRLAYGAVLVEVVENHQKGYSRLNDYLHTLTLDPNATDFTYRINRSRNSKTEIEGLKINRLMSWSLMRWNIALNFRQGEGGASVQTPQTEGFACRLELDLSTSHEFTEELPSTKLVSVWQELSGLAEEIAENGDVP
jgi:hypothetical protein